MRGDDDEIQAWARWTGPRYNGGRRPRGPFETAVEAARAVSLILVASNFSRNCVSSPREKKKKNKNATLAHTLSQRVGNQLHKCILDKFINLFTLMQLPVCQDKHHLVLLQ